MTYSIVARDDRDGSIGVAVQSAWFGVGHMAPWVNAGVGAVATQAMCDPTYGARGLALMRNGLSARRSLDALLELDDGRDSRQVAMVDSKGIVATFTGSACLDHAAHAVRGSVSCQGNILAIPGIPDRMLEAYEAEPGELVDKLLAGLWAAENAGGDARGAQSAALLVVSGDSKRDLFTDRLFDVRIDDHPTPVAELERVVRVQRAYRMLEVSGDLHMDERFEEAADYAMRAVELSVPDVNLITSVVPALLAAGRIDDARAVAALRSQIDADWEDLARRFTGEAAAMPGVDQQLFLEVLLG